MFRWTWVKCYGSHRSLSSFSMWSSGQMTISPLSLESPSKIITTNLTIIITSMCTIPVASIMFLNPKGRSGYHS